MQVIDLDYTEGSWFHVLTTGENDCLIHKSLFSSFATEMEIQGCEIVSAIPEDEVTLGPKSQDPAKLKLDLLEISLAKNLVPISVGTVANLKEEKFKNGIKFFKLRCPNFDLILSEEQKVALFQGCMALNGYEEFLDKA